MRIDGRKIADKILAYTKHNLIDLVKKKGVKPFKLVVFSVCPTAEEEAFIKNKEMASQKIGINFELLSYRKQPKFEHFANRVRTYDNDPQTTGIVIQLPLPASLSTTTLINYISMNKEIEGLKSKSPFHPPIGLAVLTVLKHIFSPINKDVAENLIVDIEKDSSLLKQIVRRKKIVLLGRGETGGQPVGETLRMARIPFINLNSKTPKPEGFISEADILISAVGKTVVKPQDIKRGAILISVGIHKEEDRWVGDYRECDAESCASYFTPTPGGIGPLTVAYLMYNLVRAAKLQYQKPITR